MSACQKKDPSTSSFYIYYLPKNTESFFDLPVSDKNNLTIEFS